MQEEIKLQHVQVKHRIYKEQMIAKRNKENNISLKNVKLTKEC